MTHRTLSQQAREASPGRARWLAALVALAVFTAAVPAGAQGASGSQATQAKGPDETVLHAYKLENQLAFDALNLAYELLSQEGTVEIKRQENTLVLRDRPQNVRRIVQALERFDHPQRPIEVEVRVVEARAAKFSPGTPSQVPKPMLSTLKELLPSHTFRILGGTTFSSREGERVSYRIGSFQLEFQVGTVLEEGRLRLHELQLNRRLGEADRTLIRTNLNLHLDQTLYLGLAPSEAKGEALMLVVTARRGKTPVSVAGTRKER